MNDSGEKTVENEPICTFPKLKECLTKKGFEIGDATPWRSVGIVEVLPEDIGQRITLEKNGIFYIDD